MIAFLDCSAGISGDMFLGSLVDAGVNVGKLKKELSRLPLKGYEVKSRKVVRNGIRATAVDVSVKKRKGARSGAAEARTWKDIEKLVKNSTLSGSIKQKGITVFRTLFESEAKVHGKRFDTVHLHELGAVDCVIDIFGTLIGLEMLGVRNITCSPVNLGSGSVKTEHGLLPVPAPATAEVLKNVPVYSSGAGCELTTPTGAALIDFVSDAFGCFPMMSVSTIGQGAGKKDLKQMPNVLRLFIGKPVPSFTGTGHEPSGAWPASEETVTVIETNIDDMNPQLFGHIFERLLKEGALDVFITQTIMKKGRPGVLLSVLCPQNKLDTLVNIILRETTTIGLRMHDARRVTLHRRVGKVKTKYGTVSVKISQFGGSVVRAVPEYDDCRKIARKNGVPLLEVINEASARALGRKAR